MNAKRIILCTVFIAHVVSLTGQTSSTDSILRFWLAPQIVNNDQPVANTLYFWTDPSDLDSVVQQNNLLRTSASMDHFETGYFSILQRNEETNPSLANYLMRGDRQRVRSAWPCYWSIIAPPEGSNPDETQLVQVVLKDSSLIVAIDEDRDKKERWRVFDLKGNIVSPDATMKRKDHIAAVFCNWHEQVVFRGPRLERFTSYERTFYLCNERMIKSWHHAVPGVQAKIMKDMDYLILLNAWLEKNENCLEQGKKGKNCRNAWYKLSSRMTIGEMLFATFRGASKWDEPASQQTTMYFIDVLRNRWREQRNAVERFPGAQ